MKNTTAPVCIAAFALVSGLWLLPVSASAQADQATASPTAPSTAATMNPMETESPGAVPPGNGMETTTTTTYYHHGGLGTWGWLGLLGLIGLIGLSGRGRRTG